jgi:hypothetical protein
MQSLCCPHCRHCPGGLAAHPFMGVNARLLVLGFFGVVPAQSAPIQACAPSSSDSSKLISLIALALAPVQTAMWPAFAADGTSPPSWPTFGRTQHPAGPALLCHLKHCPLSSSAGYPSSKQPCSAFGASPQPLVCIHTSFILQKQCAQVHKLLTHCVAQQRQRQGLVRKRMTTHCVARRRR